MGSKQSTADYLVDQMAGAGEVSARKMFGEYGVFLDGKMAAVVADDQLYVKITEPSRAFIAADTDRPVEAAFYEGGKPWFLIDGDRWEDRDWLSRLLRITADAMPAPKPKPKRKPKAA